MIPKFFVKNNLTQVSTVGVVATTCADISQTPVAIIRMSCDSHR